MVFRENMLRPTPYMPAASPKPAPKEWSDQRITVTWIGHATVLINFYGTTILTDPVLTKRLAPPNIFGMNLGIRRITQLPLEMDDLPRIDLVLLSHAHYDHWDLATLKRFKGDTQIVIPSNTADLVPQGRFSTIAELKWGQIAQVKGVTVRAVQVEHWGQRGSDKRWRSYNGYLITARGRSIFFGGDSAYCARDTGMSVDWRRRVGVDGVDLCILPIGDYYYRYNHMSPEEAWDIFKQLGGQWLMPIHWRTFITSPPDREPIFEPIERLGAAAGLERTRIVGQEPGSVFEVPEGRATRKGSSGKEAKQTY